MFLNNSKNSYNNTNNTNDDHDADDYKDSNDDDTVIIFLVQVRLRIEVLRTQSSTWLRFWTHDLQILTVHFMSMRRLL